MKKKIFISIVFCFFSLPRITEAKTKNQNIAVAMLSGILIDTTKTALKKDKKEKTKEEDSSCLFIQQTNKVLKKISDETIALLVAKFIDENYFSTEELGTINLTNFNKLLLNTEGLIASTYKLKKENYNQMKNFVSEKGAILSTYLAVLSGITIWINNHLVKNQVTKITSQISYLQNKKTTEEITVIASSLVIKEFIDTIIRKLFCEKLLSSLYNQNKFIDEDEKQKVKETNEEISTFYKNISEPLKICDKLILISKIISKI